MCHLPDLDRLFAGGGVNGIGAGLCTTGGDFSAVAFFFLLFEAVLFVFDLVVPATSAPESPAGIGPEELPGGGVAGAAGAEAVVGGAAVAVAVVAAVAVAEVAAVAVAAAAAGGAAEVISALPLEVAAEPDACS